MEQKEHLTNEEISGKFDNQFDLVNYAIKLAVNMILSGRAPRTPLRTENTALQVVEEIRLGTDKLEEASKEKTVPQFEAFVKVRGVEEVAAQEPEEAQAGAPE